MSAISRRRNGSDRILLWSASIVALCAGYYLAFGLLGAAIDQQHNQTERVSALALANAQILAQRPELEREERAIDDRLGDLQLHADKSTTVARFIHAATRVAAAQRVRLVQVEERAPATDLEHPGSHLPPQSGDDVVFEAIPLEITLRGTYRALLATIGDLAQAPVTMQIDIAAIERDTPTTGSAANDALTARLNIVLQHLTGSALVPANRFLGEDATTHARLF